MGWKIKLPKIKDIIKNPVKAALDPMVNLATLGKYNSNVLKPKGPPKAPSLSGAPSVDPGTMIYDAEGRLVSSYAKNADGNWEYRPGALKPQEIAQNAAMAQQERAVLQRMYTTPQEYISGAETEARATADLAKQEMERTYTDTTNRIAESANTRGLMGSRAWVDRQALADRARQETLGSIGMQYTANRQGLIDAKTQRDYGLLSLLSGMRGEKSAAEQANRNMAINMGGQNINSQLTGAQIANQSAMQKYALDLQRYQMTEPWRNYIMPTLNSAAMMYGGK